MRDSSYLNDSGRTEASAEEKEEEEEEARLDCESNLPSSSSFELLVLDPEPGQLQLLRIFLLLRVAS